MRMNDWSSDVCTSDQDEQRAAAVHIVRQEMVEMVAHGIFGEARGLGARQPVLGLALELRIADENRQHHFAAVEHILGGDLRRLLLPDQLAECAQPFGQCRAQPGFVRSEEPTSELQSIMRISYAVL